MVEREKVFEILDLERKIQEQRNEGTPELHVELDRIEKLIKQAKELKTYNQQLDKLRSIAGISVRCFENYGIKPGKFIKEPKKILYR